MPLYRASSNHEMEEQKYMNILKEWVASYPAATVSSILGKLICQDNQCSVQSLVRCAGLLMRFVMSGQSQCCLLPSRLESAVVKLLISDKQLVQTSVAAEAPLVTGHILICAKMMRQFRREDVLKPSPNCTRRYPKTSHLRRKMTPHDLEVLTPLLSMIEIPGEGEDDTTDTTPKKPNTSSTSPSSTPPPLSSISSPNSSSKDIAPVDVDGIPSFKAMLGTTTAMPIDELKRGGGANFVSRCKDYPVDSAGWPIFCTQLQQQQQQQQQTSSTMGQPSAATPASERIANPKPKDRKIAALSKQTKPAKRKADAPIDHVKIKKILYTQTSEKNPRFQICGMIDDDGVQKRIHICTFNKKSHANFDELGHKCVKHFGQEGMTKSLALAFKDSLLQG